MSAIDDRFAGLEPEAAPRSRGASGISPWRWRRTPSRARATALAALIYRGKPLLGFRAAQRHLSVYPFSRR